MGKKVKFGEFNPADSDGCTVINTLYKFFTKEKHLPFKECCVEHDKAYWYGGDIKLRKIADDKMRECVTSHGHPLLAWIMWVFVRIMSSPIMPFYWTWEEKVIILPKEQDPELKK